MTPILLYLERIHQAICEQQPSITSDLNPRHQRAANRIRDCGSNLYVGMRVVEMF